jgi:hypothetical protein
VSRNGRPWRATAEDKPLERVQEAFAAAGIDLRETGAGRWRGGCPACGKDDRCTVNEDLNDRVWLDCWSADCTYVDILGALGLTAADLRGAQEDDGARARRRRSHTAGSVRGARQARGTRRAAGP